jgi:hypothetical protein
MNDNHPRPQPGDDGYHAPQGTVALLAVYMLLIILSWGGIYFVMLSRGTTQ